MIECTMQTAGHLVQLLSAVMVVVVAVGEACWRRRKQNERTS